MTGPLGGAAALALLLLFAVYMHGAFTDGLNTLIGDHHLSAPLCAGLAVAQFFAFVFQVFVLAIESKEEQR